MTDETDTPTRTHAFFQTCRAYADPAVDIVGLVALAALGFSSVSDASLQILAGAIASVALGKRYIGRKQ